MEHPIQAVVTEVTVFPDRARVNCRGLAELATGSHSLVLGELPLALDPDSVRAGGQGVARVRLRNVDTRRRNYAEAPAADVRALEAEIEEQRAQLRVVSDAQAAAHAMVDHFGGLLAAGEEFARGLARGRLTIEEHQRQLGVMTTREEELRSRLRELDDQERELQKELDRMLADLEQRRSARPKQRYEVRLEVEVLSPGSFEAEVSYMLGGAGWRPLYDLRLLETGSAPQVELTALASIWQNSGQDWSGVSLAVSTARPALAQRAPEIRPWFIDVIRPMPRAAPMMHAMKAAAAEEESVADLAVGAALERAEMVTAEVSDSGSAVTYDVPDKVSIPGNGEPHKTQIAQARLDASLDYLAIPRLVDAVYRRAKLSNGTKGPLPAGDVNLFAGDEFIGQQPLKYTPVGAEIELAVGVEEQITVKRELVRRDVDKRLLRDIRQVQFGYTIKVLNLLASPARIEVKDQIPVSRHEQIKVNLDRAVPATTERKDLGEISWQLTLDKGQEQVIQYDFTVEHPRDLHVAGLVD